MPEPKPVVSLSLLDRLLDEEGSVVSRIREGMLRDLEDLLNTHPRVAGWSEHLRELDRSLLNFGIPDLSAVNLSTERHRSDMVREIGDIIRTWEPRLAKMDIFAVPNTDSSDRTLRIRIEAEIVISLSPEPVIFDTVIDPLSNRVSLKSANR